MRLESLARWCGALCCAVLLGCGGSSGRQPPHWTEGGPELTGRLSGIVVSPADPSVLVVSSPGGGVWRTADGGATWGRPLNDGLADFTVVHLEWDRVRAGRLYASTYSDLYASTNLGDSWTNLTLLGGYPAPLMPDGTTADPKPFAQLRHSASESTVLWGKPCQGLFYSSDGATFTQHWPFPGGAGNQDNCILAIAADDATGHVYFSTQAQDATGPAHVFRSALPWSASTPSLTWVSASTGLPTDSVVTAIAYGGSAGMMAAAVAVPGATRVYFTSSPTVWSASFTQPPAPSWDSRTLVSPGPNQLLLGTVVAYHTADWGVTWDALSHPGLHPDVRAFTWGSFATGNFLWMTTDGSMSDGTYAAISRWDFVPGAAPSGGGPVGLKGLRTWQPFFMQATSRAGETRRRLFLGSYDNGCVASDDGVTWSTAGTPPDGGCADYLAMAFAPNNPDRAYARTCAPDLVARSDNAFSAPTTAAVVWTAIKPSLDNHAPRLWCEGMIAVDPQGADHVAFANDLNVGVSDDGGTTWSHHGLPGNALPVCVYFSPLGELYAGTLERGAYKSKDNGVTWTPFGLNTDSPKAILRIAHSPAGGAEGTFFLATTSGLFRKLPGGAFLPRSGDPAYTVSDVVVDPTNPLRVCISHGFAFSYGRHRGGVLESLDNAETFTSLTAGLDLHQAPIASLQFDPADPRRLYAAVFGLGGWTYGP